jgi:hypothetical protein
MKIKMQTVKSYMTFELIWNKFWNKKLHAQENIGKRNMLHTGMSSLQKWYVNIKMTEH